MRTIIDPPPSARCDHCRGELRLKQVTEATSRDFDLVEELFVCAECGREQRYTTRHDHNSPHLKSR